MKTEKNDENRYLRSMLHFFLGCKTGANEYREITKSMRTVSGIGMRKKDWEQAARLERTKSEEIADRIEHYTARGYQLASKLIVPVEDRSSFVNDFVYACTSEDAKELERARDSMRELAVLPSSKAYGRTTVDSEPGE